MTIYKRYIDKKLLSLRLSFFILGTICFVAFKYQNENLGYFIAVVLITLSIIDIRNFVINSDSFRISKYYFFGLIGRTWQFNKRDNIKVSSFDSDFGQDVDVQYTDVTFSEIGCLFSFFFIFFPPKVTMKEFKVEKFDVFNRLSESVNVSLNKLECRHLQTFIHQHT